MKTSWKPLFLVFALSGLFFVIFVTTAFTIFSKGGDGKGKTGTRALFKKESVGVIELNGVIMDSKKFLRTLKKFEDAEGVKSIVVRINSPGGAVAPSQEIFEAVKKFPKPVVASMSSVAASGGYYVAVAAKKVYANPGTITGSIGVIMEFANLEKLYEWAKIKRYSIKTGKYKDAGTDTREMQPDERALLQGMVDDVLLQFKTAVAAGRNLPLDVVTPLADGRIFSGAQAKEAKLVDELGTLEDAVNEAGKLGGIEGKPRVSIDEPKKNFMEMLREQMQQDEEESSSSTSRPWWVKSLAHALGIQPPQVSLDPGIYWIWKGAL